MRAQAGVSDLVAEDRLDAADRAERGSYVGCIAGALSKGEYIAGLEAAGFEHVSVEFTHEVADGMHGAILKAVKTSDPATKGLPVIRPADAKSSASSSQARPLRHLDSGNRSVFLYSATHWIA
jgi:hypothetical protein